MRMTDAQAFPIMEVAVRSLLLVLTSPPPGTHPIAPQEPSAALQWLLLMLQVSELNNMIVNLCIVNHKRDYQFE